MLNIEDVLWIKEDNTDATALPEATEDDLDAAIQKAAAFGRGKCSCAFSVSQEMRDAYTAAGYRLVDYSGGVIIYFA